MGEIFYTESSSVKATINIGYSGDGTLIYSGYPGMIYIFNMKTGLKIAMFKLKSWKK